jgi:antitoxin ParD1/3/4
LSDHQSAFVESLVRSGRYQNASEVLRDGLRLVESREAENAARLAALRAAVDLGWADVAAGRYTDLDADGVEAFVAESGEAGSAGSGLGRARG